MDKFFADKSLVRSDLINTLKSAASIKHVRDINIFSNSFEGSENTTGCKVNNIDLGYGKADISVDVKPELFIKFLPK